MGKLKPIQRIREDVREGDIVRLVGSDNGKPIEAVGYVGANFDIENAPHVHFWVHSLARSASEIFHYSLDNGELWVYSADVGERPIGKIEDYEVLRRKR